MRIMRSFLLTGFALLALARTLVAADESLTLNLLTDAAEKLDARCLDGSPAAYYWRPGKGNHSNSFIIFFEGGGWCGPGANCLARSKTALGSSKSYPPTIPNTGYEGGTGFLSGESTLTAFSDFGVAYVKYCTGGSFTGSREGPVPTGNTSLWYRGGVVRDAVIADLKATKGLDNANEVIISGCSAGGQACYIACDPIAQQLKAPTKCICDAGMFQDLVSISGVRNVEPLFTSIVEVMNSTHHLPEACLELYPDKPVNCFFAALILPTLKTPTFAIQSLYNFMGYTYMSPEPPSYLECFPGNGKLTPESYATCNSTQKSVIQHFRSTIISVYEPFTNPASPHGTFLTACPNQHCETSTGWNMVTVNSNLMRNAVAEWYFGSKSVKIVDGEFPNNPTCISPSAATACPSSFLNPLDV